MEALAQHSPAPFPPLPNPVVSDIATPTPQARVASPVGPANPPAATAGPVNGLPPVASVVSSTLLPHLPRSPLPSNYGPSAHAPAPGPIPGLESHPVSATPQAATEPSRWATTPTERHSQRFVEYTPHKPPSAAQSAKSQATRYVIMDPPSRLKVTPMSGHSSRGYPSPTTDYARESPKFVDDSGRITCAIQQSVPEAVRRVVRENWEKCLLGSEFHQAFILNAAVHHSLPNTTRRAVRDFGAKLVTDCKHEIIKHFATKDIDEVAEHILSVASNDFLDECLEKRLLTIEAKPLIQALARAERLGYEPSDIVEEGASERVIPSTSSGPQVAAGLSYPQQQQQQPKPQLPHPSSHTPGGRLQCLKCYRVFSHPSAYEYHSSKDVCSRAPPSAEGFRFACQYCGQGFTTAAGLQYHNANKVCGDFGEQSPSSRGPGRPPRDRLSSASSTVAPLAAQPVHQAVHATPPAVLAQHAAAASDRASRSSPNPADPYAHLTAQQLDAMQEELRDAELKYTAKFQDAELIPDPDERRIKLDGLRNSFGTKQSMIRKKYGVRLRERRRKAEIQAERDRMGVGLKATPASTPSTVPARRSLDTSNRTPTPVKSSSGWTAANGPQPPESANDDQQQNNKRRRLNEGENGAADPYQTPYTLAVSQPPPQRLAVTEMGGGLGQSPATAAHRDPTLPQPPPASNASAPGSVSQQGGARVEIHLPRGSSLGSARGASNTNSNPQAQSTYATPASRASSSGATDTKAPAVDEDEDDTSDDGDEDIPAKLPANVRQSLTPRDSRQA